MNNLDSICIQSGYNPKDGEARTLPIYQSTTFVYKKAEDMAALFDLKKDGFFYSRIANPTCDALEKKMAELDGAVGALATASGQAATLITVLNVCSCGDHIVSMATIYGGTHNLLAVTLKKMGITCTFLNPNCTEDELNDAIQDNTKIIFGETFANPAMNILDFDKIAKVAKKNNVLFVVDNTLATAVITKPGDFGANVIIYSTTKYAEGHASSIGGMVVDMGNFTYDKERYPDFSTPDESYHGLVYNDLGKLAFITKARVQLMRDLGIYMSANTAYLTNLGLETLAMRMEKHSSNALAVATYLENNDKVEWVKYPYLESGKDFNLAKKYMKMGSGVLVFGLKGDRSTAEKFIYNLEMIKNVTHVADIRSCILHPASTTHRQLSQEALVNAGISENLIRLSVGCENVEDIISDIASSLEKL